MRASTNIVLKERRMLQLSDFRGVDFSSSPLRVTDNRASKMKNFINEYGVNKKRNGWRQLLKITYNNEPQKINGIFNYVIGNHRDLIIHAGKRFYKVTDKDGSGLYGYTDITTSGTYELSQVDTTRIKDTRSQAFFNKGRCYIIGCGDYLVYGTWDNGETYELRRVANDIDTYIPTTMTAINNDLVDVEVDKKSRTGLDEINLLSGRRINRLYGVEDEDRTWTLDANIDVGSYLKITIETIENDVTVTYLLENTGEDKTILYKTKKDDTSLSDAINVGTIDFANGKITINIPTTPQAVNIENMYVEFSSNKAGYLDRICNCNFGVLFGVNGNTDSLFLSGNSDYANIDFHSAMNDYTYFSYMNTSAMGSDSVAINGYARLSDSTLVTYKEENTQEATIFYRQGEYKDFYDSNGNVETRGVFPILAGSIGEGVVSRYACVNFSGDNIILSKNGVFGIVLSDNVATSERYTRERSRSINEKLKMHSNLSEAVGIVYKNRYYLAIDDVCYVADSRYKYVSEDSLDGTFNYEWWYWDNIPARVWANIDNTLFFGSSDGLLCVFDDEYTDRTYQVSEDGDIGLNVANNKITYSQDINIGLKDNDRLKFANNNVYSLMISNAQVENSYIKTDDDSIFMFHNGMEVYADNIGDSGLSVNTKYVISDIDLGSCVFKLLNESGTSILINDGGFSLHKNISNITLYLHNTTANSFQLKENLESEVVNLSIYNDNTPTSLIARFSHSENVVAEWYTPILDLGTNVSSKTLLKMTISTEPEVNGKLAFGYETKNVNKLINAKGINLFSLENFSFENFSFDTGFANSYSVKCNERNFNFIVFRFVSNNDSNCIINNFTIIYKINKENKGVR